MAKPTITKEQSTAGTAQWFWLKMERGQSNVMLRHLEKAGNLPSGVDPADVLKACLKDSSGGRPRVTTVDEKILLKLLGTGKLPDEQIRDVLVYASPFAVMRLHRKRPDLLPSERVVKFIREEAMILVEDLYVRKRQNDKRLAAFVRQLEEIPGFKEIVTVHAVHAL